MIKPGLYNSLHNKGKEGMELRKNDSYIAESPRVGGA